MSDPRIWFAPGSRFGVDCDDEFVVDVVSLVKKPTISPPTLRADWMHQVDLPIVSTPLASAKSWTSLHRFADSRLALGRHLPVDAWHEAIRLDEGMLIAVR